MAKIRVQKYYKPSLGKTVNKAGYDRNVSRIPDRDVYAKPITKDSALLDSEKDFLLSHPIDFANEEKREVHSFSELQEGKWLQIDSTKGIGINYAMKKGDVAHIYTGRYYGADYMIMTRKAFNDWRKNIDAESESEYGARKTLQEKREKEAGERKIDAVTKELLTLIHAIRIGRKDFSDIAKRLDDLGVSFRIQNRVAFLAQTTNTYGNSIVKKVLWDDL